MAIWHLCSLIHYVIEVLLRALIHTTSTVLQKSTSLRHASSNHALVVRLVPGELPLSCFHHLINCHVLFELQLSSLIAHESLILTVNELSLVASLSTSDSLELLHSIRCHHLTSFIFKSLSLLLLVLYPLVCENTLLHALRTVVVDLGVILWIRRDWAGSVSAQPSLPVLLLIAASLPTVASLFTLLAIMPRICYDVARLVDHNHALRCLFTSICCFSRLVILQRCDSLASDRVYITVFGLCCC